MVQIAQLCPAGSVMLQAEGHQRWVGQVCVCRAGRPEFLVSNSCEIQSSCGVLIPGESGDPVGNAGSRPLWSCTGSGGNNKQ